MNLLGEQEKCNGKIWKVIGGVALAVVAAGIIANFHDIKRYIRITTM